jgi:ubiquinone/menaquinone biosynthesis C-methylase UbiE
MDEKKKHKAASHTETSWGGVADWYDTLLAGDDTYQSQVILPNMLRLVAPQGKKILDIACGQGFFSHHFIKEGAAEVLGADISPELIEKASAVKSSAQFVVAPANRMPDAASDYFDTATLVLALQNIKEMKETIEEAYRTLRSGGVFVIVLNHPSFRIPKASSWGFDEAADVQFRRVDGYGRPFETHIQMTPGQSSEHATVSFHRPLQDYFKALSNAGFVVTGLEEWVSHKKSQPGPRAKAEDRARVEFPMFLTIVAKKA